MDTNPITLPCSLARARVISLVLLRGTRLTQGGGGQMPHRPPKYTPVYMCNVCVKLKLERIIGNTICGYLNMNRKFNNQIFSHILKFLLYT